MSHDSIVNLPSTTQAKNKSTDSSINKHFTDTLELDVLQSGLSSLMMSSIQVSKLKAEAKKTKKEFNLKLTENQDRLAKVIGMKNWKEVTLAHTNYLVKETAFKEGVVVVLRKENLSKLYQGEEHFTLDHELYKFMLSDIYNDKFGNVHWWDNQQTLIYAHKEQWFQTNFEENYSFFRLKAELVDKYSLIQVLLLISIAHQGVPAYIKFKGELHTYEELKKIKI